MKTFKELETLVIQWGEEKNLYCPENGATVLTQTQKFFEEFGELNEALLKRDLGLLKDSIGDCQVCLISIARLKKVDIANIAEMSYIESIKHQELHKKVFEQDNSELQDEAILKCLFRIAEYANSNIEDCFLLLEYIGCIFGFKRFECIEFAYNEIKDRKGKMINRVFVKDA